MKSLIKIFLSILIIFGISSALNIRTGNHGDFYRIVIESEKNTDFEKISFDDPPMLILKIKTSKLPNLQKSSKAKKPPFIKDFEIIKSNENIKLFLELKEGIDYKIFTLDNPNRIVIDIGDKEKIFDLEPDIQSIAKGKIDKEDHLIQNDPISEIIKTSSLEDVKKSEIKTVKKVSNRKENLKIAKIKTDDPILAIIENYKKEQFSIPTNITNVSENEKKIIVIDPGHGGHDPGAVRNGLKEKDVNLKFAKKLKEILERDPRFKVYLTRTTDRFVPLYNRTVFALEKKADLFISLHCNSSKSGRGSGTYIYTLNLRGAKSKLARLVELRENKTVIKYVKFSSKKYVNRIIADLAISTTMTEGRIFATIAKKYLRSTVDFRGIDSANFAVLKTPGIPSILVEIAYLTNPIDVQLLKSDIFAEQFSKSLYRAITKYFYGYQSIQTAEK